MHKVDLSAFPTEPLPSGNLCATYGASEFEEANAFLGKKWTIVDRDFAHYHHDAVFWFTPEAFHYYLPAFLAAAVDGDGIEELFAGSIVRLLHHDPTPGFDAFRKERWSLLTEGQIEALNEWLSYLRDEIPPNSIYLDDIETAIAAVKERAWRNW